MDAPEDVERLFDGLRRARERGFFTRDRAYREIGEEVAYGLMAHPDWIVPHVDDLVRAGVADGMFQDFKCDLLQHASEQLIVEVIERLRRDPRDFSAQCLLLASRHPCALEEIGRLAATDSEWRTSARRSGLHVGTGRPAIPRFSLQRFGLRFRCDDVLDGHRHVFGLPLEAVVAPGESRLKFHYLSVEPCVLPELAHWPGRAHLVGVRSWTCWTLRAEADEAGRLKVRDIALRADRSLDTRSWLKDLDRAAADEQPRGFIELLPYDSLQTWVGMTLRDAADGVLGGPPHALEDPPDCPDCGRLMFHLAGFMHGPREYGDGRRLLFVCEDCRCTGVLATMFN